MTWIQILAIATAVTVPLESSAATLYVSQNSTSPSLPYATPGTAAHNIQDAVHAANDGDKVLVGPGEYNLTNQVSVTKAITLQSTAGAGQTLLIASGNNWCLWVSNSLAVVDGFTLRSADSEYLDAGGIESFGTTIQNCIFTNFSLTGPAPYPAPGTSVTMSGGVLSNSVVFYYRYPGGSDANAVYSVGGGLVTDCQVLGIAGPSGTGVHLENSQILNSVVTGTGQGGSGYSAGPAVNAVNSTIIGCTISNNTSIELAGGAYLDNCLMDRCIVAYNTYRNPDRCWGGGIFEVNSIIRDSTIIGNTLVSGGPYPQTSFGAGIYMQGGAVVNCTVAENRALSCPPDSPGYGVGVYVESGGITNSIIFENFVFGCTNGENEWFNAGPGIFDHCCTAPDPGGVGNLVLDPQFVDPTNGNVHLATNSPCIGAGIVQDWMAGATDLDGNPRTSNGKVDIGAYEAASASPAPSSLRIFATGTNTLIIAWPARVTGYVLEENSHLGSSAWSGVNATPSVVNGENQVTVYRGAVCMTYRLHHN